MINGEVAVQHHALAFIGDYTAFNAVWQKNALWIIQPIKRCRQDAIKGELGPSDLSSTPVLISDVHLIDNGMHAGFQISGGRRLVND